MSIVNNKYTYFHSFLQSSDSCIHYHIVLLTCYTVPRPYNDRGKVHMSCLIYVVHPGKLN